MVDWQHCLFGNLSDFSRKRLENQRQKQQQKVGPENLQEQRREDWIKCLCLENNLD